MALFDFLKPKVRPMAPVKTPRANRPECDINKTNIVVQLLNVARDKRDANWNGRFYENVINASFACGKPQLLTGPDGFTYFILRTPEDNKPFESFCIKNMTEDFLLEKGWGVVFNPAENGKSDWVFTHGNIVNLHLNNRFFSDTEDAAIANIEFTKNVGVIKKAEQVMIAQPSAAYLPYGTRAALKRFLQSKGITKPKMMMLTSYQDGLVLKKLAFNIDPRKYPVVSHLDHLMQQVGWFLPNDYIIIPLPANSELAKGLNDM